MGTLRARRPASWLALPCLLAVLLLGPGPVRAREGELPEVQVTLGKLTVLGSLDKNIIQRILLRRLPEIRACYLDALHRAPTVAGTLEVRFIIAPTGLVTQAAAKEGSLKGTRLARCVERKLVGMRFHGGCSGGIVMVTAPWSFDLAPSRPREPAPTSGTGWP